MSAQIKLPYLASPGVAPKILGRMKEARRPDRFTQDFLETKLGHSGGSARAIIPLLKRMNFISSDGTPNYLYDKFRNPTTSKAAVATGIRNAYAEVFDRNTYAGDLSRDKLKNLILEMTGLERDNTVANLIVSTFWMLKGEADFEANLEEDSQDNEGRSLKPEKVIDMEQSDNRADQPPLPRYGQPEIDFRVGYTINLNLPETTNVEVFNAIFRALNDNLLRRP